MRDSLVDARRYALALVVACVGLAAGAAPARADCASGADYVAEVMAGTVKVLPDGTSRKCGGPIPMLRENVGTGEVALLPDHCAAGWYVDECVPAGTYRYGFATAYDCSEGGCAGVQYYVTTTVPAMASPCTPSSGSMGVTAYTGAVPWASSSLSLKECPSRGGCALPGRRALGTVGFDVALFGVSLVWILRRRRASRR